MFCWHKWSEWKQVSRGEIVRSSTQRVVGYFILQERVCQKCGKIEINKQETY